MRAFLLLLFTILLSACALVPVAPTSQGTPVSWALREAQLSNLHHWKVTGAIGVKTARNGFNASYVWLQTNNDFHIELSGPLGAGAIKLNGYPGKITLQDKRGVFQSTSPDALLSQHMGWHLPVANLKYWIRGIPAPSSIASKQFDQYHRLQTLVQDGWTIQYQSYTSVNNIELPSRILLNAPNARVKLVMRSWSF